ncbi:MAG: response regulator, partial [Ferruginibacter sp.]
PVVILSGLSDTALSLKAISIGAQDFLLKGAYNSQSLEKCVWYSIERKKNIELLRENNERYDIISKATNDIIWDWDLVIDKVKWVGQGLKNYIPLEKQGEEIPYDFWVTGLHKDERRNVVASLYATVASGENSWERDYRFLRTDGVYAYINSRAYVIKNDEQKPIRMIGSMQDITDRKNAELETQKARFEAEEARKTQEQFLANMSHEIRTPMNGVIGMTQLLEETLLNKDQREYVETIKESAANLMVIINDILDLTKIVAGKISIVQTDYVFNDVINNSIKINQFRADEKGIALKVNIDKNIYPVLYGDPGRLNQIMINLIGNAVKFTEQGEINVNIDLLKEDTQSVTLEFSVTDTGIGIAEDKVESVFDRFMQVSGASTRKYGGTGLGLTITRQLIELQGGSIHVTSKKDEGSIFTFYLTISKATSSHDNEKKPVVKTNTNLLAGVTVLLVEDNIINQKVAIKTLNNLGAIVEVANNGIEAIEFLMTKECDLILMDIQMPEMDGYEATRIIRAQANDTIKSIPIIAMTASALIADREKCITAGMNDYIAKPFHKDELYEKIITQLERSAGQIKKSKTLRAAGILGIS